MGRGGARGRIATSLDDRVVLWEPQPGYLVTCGPREQSLVSLVPLLDQLRESVWSKIGIDGLVGVDLPRVLE